MQDGVTKGRKVINVGELNWGRSTCNVLYWEWGWGICDWGAKGRSGGGCIRCVVMSRAVSHTCTELRGAKVERERERERDREREICEEQVAN